MKCSAAEEAAIITTLLKQKSAGNSSESGFKPSVWPLVEFSVSKASSGDVRKDLQHCKTCYHKVSHFYCLHMQCLTDFLPPFPSPHCYHCPHDNVPLPSASVPAYAYASSHTIFPCWLSHWPISHATTSLFLARPFPLTFSNLPLAPWLSHQHISHPPMALPFPDLAEDGI